MNKGTDRMSETSFQGKGSIFEEYKIYTNKDPMNLFSQKTVSLLIAPSQNLVQTRLQTPKLGNCEFAELKSFEMAPVRCS